MNLKSASKDKEVLWWIAMAAMTALLIWSLFGNSPEKQVDRFKNLCLDWCGDYGLVGEFNVSGQCNASAPYIIATCRCHYQGVPWISIYSTSERYPCK